MSTNTDDRHRSRSPHHPNRSPVSPNKPPRKNSLSSNTPEYKALWRRRREEAEADDYRERLSPNRQISPARISPHRERKNSWAQEDDGDNDEWLGRAERALSGLDRYEKKFKRYTPDILEKENSNPNSSGTPKSKRPMSSGSRRERSLSPKPQDIEKDTDVLMRRQKDIDYGKNTEQYQEYITELEKNERLDKQPWTPDKYEKMTRRNWDKQVKIWRKQLHYWRDPKPVSELLTPNTSPCPSPHRASSPPASRLQLQVKTKLFEEEDDCAMDSFENQKFPNSILSNAALNCVKQQETADGMGVDDNSNSQMSCDDVQLPQAFKN